MLSLSLSRIIIDLPLLLTVDFYSRTSLPPLARLAWHRFNIEWVMPGSLSGLIVVVWLQIQEPGEKSLKALLLASLWSLWNQVPQIYAMEAENSKLRSKGSHVEHATNNLTNTSNQVTTTSSSLDMAI
ncbi:uncharacterized protein LOC114270471 isoform X2 [Camellia sinensis]|uniref:uncharacterized protein LOC114270471 isoform X2 n=1 Tax=Camellia sinensis TaxID=4442 RepID=UPI0010359D62|nr:uncharacterized protein LOC114270471 isoform X2 [Camellia sinensis]